jgi:pimeloyl-ACP methyl ester carboxylesterase
MSKMPLLLLPGLVCDDAVWEVQSAQLADIAAPRIADYGLLSSIPEMAAMVLRSAPPRFAVAGHSMGGRVALELYRQAPQRVLCLALLDTGYQARPAGDAGEKEAAGRFALLDVSRREGMRAMASRWTPGMVHPGRLKDTSLMDAIAAMVARKTPDIFAAQIQALLDRPEATNLLAQIGCPTLVLCGRQDAWSPLARHEDMARAIPDSTLVAIEDSGHMSTMERPGDVAAALRTWLATSLHLMEQPA